MINEEWRDVLGFEGSYQVSNAGRVRSVDRQISRLNRWGTISVDNRKGHVLSPASNAGGHLFVALGKDNPRFVHRLVLAAFVRERREGEECRHLDGDPKNNQLDNLAWGTRSENIQDRKRLGEENPARGEKSGRAIFTESDVRYIRAEHARGRSFGHIAKEFGASRGGVGRVIMGYTWAWLT